MKDDSSFASPSVLVLAAAVAVAACDGPAADGAAGPAWPSQFCAQRRAIAAAVNSRCLTGSIADWIDYAAGLSDCAHLDALVAKGTIRYNRDEAAACLAAASAPRDCYVIVECSRKALEGRLAPGAPCTDGFECPSNATCLEPVASDFNMCGTSVCTVLPVTAGDACVDRPVCFSRGLTCIAGTCEANLPEGATCDATTPSCAGGLTCGPTGICVPLGAAGDACRSLSDCPSAMFCSSNTCAALVDVGGACDPAVGGCVRFATCDQPTSKCISAGHVGEPCDRGFFCIKGNCVGATGAQTCQPLANLGETCTGGRTCASHGCKNGLCATCP